MRDFDAVFGERRADTKAPGDFFGGAAGEHEASQRGVRNQRRCADSVRLLFIGFVVVAGKNLALARPLSRPVGGSDTTTANRFGL